MTVKELIERLSKCRQDDLVVVAKDAEGNGFEELYTIEAYRYNYDRHENEIGIRSLDQSAIDAGYGEEDVMDGEPCVVIWP